MILSGVVLLIYFVFILIIILGFDTYKTPITKGNNKVKLTILIPTRNPRYEKLNQLINQIQFQFPSDQYDIIIIDDCSTDEITLEGDLRILKVKEAFPELTDSTRNKKQAIRYGVEQSANEYILCLDDDVKLSANFYQSLISEMNIEESKFIAGIHKHDATMNLVSKFAKLEQDVLSYFSIATLSYDIPTMCNGAFMIFSKRAFQAVNGYEGVEAIESGDDMFLFHRIHSKYPKETRYLKSKDCFVSSEPPYDISTLLNQRRRWLSKSFDYENYKVLILAAAILIFNISIIAVGMPLLLVKIGIDFLIVLRVKRYFKNDISLLNTVFFSLLYPVYVIVVLSYCLLKR